MHRITINISIRRYQCSRTPCLLHLLETSKRLSHHLRKSLSAQSLSTLKLLINRYVCNVLDVFPNTIAWKIWMFDAGLRKSEPDGTKAFGGLTRAKKSIHASDCTWISGKTVCERRSKWFETIETVGDGICSCACGCSARDIRPRFERLPCRPRVAVFDFDRPDEASAEASCVTSASIRATCAATHTPSCTFASSTVRLSVLVSIDTAMGRVRRPS